LTRDRWLAVVLIVALPVAATGCDGDEETEAPAPSRQEYVAQADAICRSAEQDLKAAQQGSGSARVEEAEFVEQEIVPILQRQLDEIQELPPPPGDEGNIEAALLAAEEDLSDLSEDPSRVPEGMRELHRQLQRYGSTTCVD
jgi:hypothetical protein